MKKLCILLFLNTQLHHSARSKKSKIHNVVYLETKGQNSCYKCNLNMCILLYQMLFQSPLVLVKRIFMHDRESEHRNSKHAIPFISSSELVGIILSVKGSSCQISNRQPQLLHCLNFNKIIFGPLTQREVERASRVRFVMFVCLPAVTFREPSK